jgi:hypothetical protein
MVANAMVFLEGCSHFAIAVRPVMNVLQFSEMHKLFFYPIRTLRAHAKALKPHCPFAKLTVFGWFCAYNVHADSSQLFSSPAWNQIRACRETHLGSHSMSTSCPLPRKAMIYVNIASGGQATLCNDVSGKAAVIGGNRALP